MPFRVAVSLLVFTLCYLVYHHYHQIGQIDDAAQHGDVEKVKALLNNNPHLVFSKDKDGNTPLHWAMRFGNSDAAALLLAHGADVNATDNQGRTPFYWAVAMDDPIMMKFLSEHGARPPDATIFDAATYGDLEKAKALLKDNPDLVFSIDDHGYTPLHLAVKNDHKDVVELLLLYKADVNGRAADMTAQVNAYQKAHPDENVAYPNMRETPLHMAAMNGHMDMVELLLTNKANVNAEEYGGFTPLLNAVLGDHKDVAELLLANGADVNAGNSGQTPLHLAARYGYKDMAVLLLTNKADVNARFSNGQTPLQMAIGGMVFPDTRPGCEDVIKLLVTNHADVNAKDKSGKTALIMAVEGWYPDIVKLLIASGADVNAKQKNGRTALDDTVQQGNRNFAKVLLANKAEVNTIDTNGWTPLHFAAELGQKDMAELLLVNGAEANAKDDHGDTPLDIATDMEHKYPESEGQPLRDTEDLLRQHGGHE